MNSIPSTRFPRLWPLVSVGVLITMALSHQLVWAGHLDAIEDRIRREYASLESLYRHFHSHPELSFHEEQTAKRIASELRLKGFVVTENVGGYGVVGVLKNGSGPTVLVRTDLDALPVVEATGLPYASKM